MIDIWSYLKTNVIRKSCEFRLPLSYLKQKIPNKMLLISILLASFSKGHVNTFWTADDWNRMVWAIRHFSIQNKILLFFLHIFLVQCVVCCFSIYGFWLPIWNLQTFLEKKMFLEFSLDVINLQYLWWVKFFSQSEEKPHYFHAWLQIYSHHLKQRFDKLLFIIFFCSPSLPCHISLI